MGAAAAVGSGRAVLAHLEELPAALVAELGAGQHQQRRERGVEGVADRGDRFLGLPMGAAERRRDDLASGRNAWRSQTRLVSSRRLKRPPAIFRRDRTTIRKRLRPLTP
jgi:hypothetical protein